MHTHMLIARLAPVRVARHTVESYTVFVAYKNLSQLAFLFYIGYRIGYIGYIIT